MERIFTHHWCKVLRENTRSRSKFSNFTHPVTQQSKFQIRIFGHRVIKTVQKSRRETTHHGWKVPRGKTPPRGKIFDFYKSLLEYKAMNVERQHGIFVEPWSDSIHIPLQRNDGFLHSFHDFSRSSAFTKNVIRTKFILHKIFF